MEASRQLCEQAQSCFSFVDREGLADATADVYAAVRGAGVGLRVLCELWKRFTRRGWSELYLFCSCAIVFLSDNFS